MNRQTRIGLAAIVVILLIVMMPIQQRLDYLRYNPKSKSGLQPAEIISSKHKKETGLLFDMSLQFMGAAALGMREAVASMLWVRADEFFHAGEYEAILPLVRMVTWLDPHQLDVYSTGAWHLDFNFTDSDERSDRRYIPPAIGLMKEGIRNNPEIYDLYFDLGWMHYLQKLKNYHDAAYWINKATKLPASDPNTGQMGPRPSFVDRMLAHAYEKDGQLDKCEAQWAICLKQAEDLLKDDRRDSAAAQDMDVSKKNLGLLLLRRAWRNGDMAAYKRGIETLETLNEMDPIQKRALEGAKNNYAELSARGEAPHDTSPPVDAGFSVTWKKIKSKELLIEGKLSLVPAEAYKGLASECYTFWYEDNVLKAPADRKKKWQDGCRVRILLEDSDYDYFKLPGNETFDWEVDKNLTVMVDDVMVRNGEFRIKIDMSRDPDIYPFKHDTYKLIVWFNPQEAPDYIQDRIGWRGEGLTDKNHLDTKTIPGVRIIRKEFILKRSDIL